MEDRVIERVEEKIQHILDEDINTNNLDFLYKLSKVKHMAKEDKEMNYGNYMGRGPGYDTYGRGGSYGNYGNYGDGSYGRQGYDQRYRGHDALDRMYENYGRYQDGRQRYGASEETDKSFYYMIKSLEDFIKVLEEEADTPQQKQQLKMALQNAMR